MLINNNGIILFFIGKMLLTFQSTFPYYFSCQTVKQAWIGIGAELSPGLALLGAPRSEVGPAQQQPVAPPPASSTPTATPLRAVAFFCHFFPVCIFYPSSSFSALCLCYSGLPCCCLGVLYITPYALWNKAITEI